MIFANPLHPGSRLWIKKGFSMYFWITQDRLLPQAPQNSSLILRHYGLLGLLCSLTPFETSCYQWPP